MNQKFSVNKSFFLHICRLGCNLIAIIDRLASQTVYWQICTISREDFSMWTLDFFFSAFLPHWENRWGWGKQASYLKRNISANTEISNEIKRLSFPQLSSTPCIWQKEEWVSKTIFFMSLNSISSAYSYIHSASMFFLSVWNCKEDWTLKFSVLQLANVSRNPSKYLICEPCKVLKDHLKQKGDSTGYWTIPSFIEIFGNSNNHIDNSRINIKNSTNQECFTSVLHIAYKDIRSNDSIILDSLKHLSKGLIMKKYISSTEVSGN